VVGRSARIVPRAVTLSRRETPDVAAASTPENERAGPKSIKKTWRGLPTMTLFRLEGHDVIRRVSGRTESASQHLSKTLEAPVRRRGDPRRARGVKLADLGGSCVHPLRAFIVKYRRAPCRHIPRSLDGDDVRVVGFSGDLRALFMKRRPSLPRISEAPSGRSPSIGRNVTGSRSVS